MGMNEAKAWGAVLVALVAAQGCVADASDIGMRYASDDELNDWADDLESRVGLDVSSFRAALADYTAARR